MNRPSSLTSPSLDSFGIVSQPWGGAGKSWTLPRRDLGKFRHAGWLFMVPILFAIPFLGGILSFLLPALMGVFNAANANGPAPLDWLPLIFIGGAILIFIFAARRVSFIVSSLLGVLTQSTYCTILLNEEEIQVQEKFGWGSWKRKDADRSLVLSLAVVTLSDWIRIERQFKGDSQSHGTFNLPDAINYGLVARLQDGGAFPITVGYSAELLHALAVDIGRELRLSEEAVLSNTQVSSSLAAAEPLMAIDVLSPGAVPRVIEVSQPRNSKIEIERREDGVTLTVPSQGLVKGSKGLFTFAILWISFSTFICGAILWNAVHANQWQGNLFLLVFIAVFEGIGIAMILGGIHMGTRSSVLATSYGSLFISSVSVFGKKTKQWASDTVASIEVAPSGIEVNDRPVMHLFVIGTDGKSFGCLTQLDEPDLEWVAFELRRSLELDASTEADPAT